MMGLMNYLEINSAIVVGHSMGGYIAGCMAASYPGHVSGLAILDKSAAGPEKENDAPLHELNILDPVTGNWPLPSASLSESQAVIRRDMESKFRYQYSMNSLTETEAGPGMMFSAQAITANIAYYSDWYPFLRSLQCPVPLIRAKGGGAVSDADFEKMKSAIPNCMAREMSDPDRYVHLADTPVVYGRFDGFRETAAGKK